MSRGRRLLLAVSLAVAALAAAAWLLLAAGGAGRMAWQPASGRLLVLDGGVDLLPRWSWRRHRGDELRARVDASSREGSAVGVEVRWRPEPGEHRLSPAADPEAGLAANLEPAVRERVRSVAFPCLAAELRETAADCPPDLAEELRRALADRLGTPAARLAVAVQPDPETVTRGVWAALARRYPPAGRKVLVLGLDGLDWDLVLPWVREGRMPNLARLLERGTWGNLETLVPILSPLIWTTVATGVPPDRHGILDFVERDPQTGRMVPVTGRSRRVPALWNVASALGREVGVVGWWASWPAEEVAGTMVSDRLYYTLTQGLDRAVFREDPPGIVHPAARTEQFTRLRDEAVQSIGWETVSAYMAVSRDRYSAAVEADRGMEDPVDGFRRVLASTRTYLGSGLEIAARRPDLLMVYLEGTDTIGHLLAPYMPPPVEDSVDPQTARTYAAAVPAYFEEVDRWLGRYLAACPLDEYAVVVVSDHGFRWSEGRPRNLGEFSGQTAPLWHAPDAVYVLAGAGVEARGRVGEPASVYDVAPTVAALLGLPPGEGWQGSPLPGVGPAAHEPLDYESLVPPASYRSETGGPAPADPEFLAQLEALGYLGGDSEARAPQPAATAGTRPAPTAENGEGDGPGPTRGELNNLAVLKINAKEYDEAERILRRAIARSPDYSSPHYNLRRIYLETRRYDQADRELWIAVEKGLRDALPTVDRAAGDYDSLGLYDRSLALLDEAIRRFPDHEPFHVHRLVNRIRNEQCREALPEGREAAARFDDSAPVHAFYGLAAACAGEPALARREIGRSLELNPAQPHLRRTLAGLEPPG